MFDLNKDMVRIANVNARAEKHGDEDVLACDIKCEAKMSNSVLSKFSDTLKSCLYTQDDGAIADMINPDHAPKLRNPLMGPINWNYEMPSVQFRVHHGETDDDDIVFSDAKANKFTFLCQEGGTVVVGFRIQTHPDEALAAKLLMLLNHSVKVSLITELGDNNGDGEEGEGEESTDSQASGDGEDLLSGGDAQENSEADEKGDGSDPEYGFKYRQVLTFLKTQDHASISAVKRELKLSTLDATKILDDMETNGVLGPAAGNGVRPVLATTE